MPLSSWFIIIIIALQTSSLNIVFLKSFNQESEHSINFIIYVFVLWLVYFVTLVCVPTSCLTRILTRNWNIKLLFKKKTNFQTKWKLLPHSVRWKTQWMDGIIVRMNQPRHDNEISKTCNILWHGHLFEFFKMCPNRKVFILKVSICF